MSKHECCSENGKCNVWKCIGWGILGVIGFTALIALFGWAIMALWNWLLPSLFNLPIISYFQAVGLAVLSRLLFGGCGKGMHRMHHKYMRSKGSCGCGCDCSCNCSCGSNCNCKSDKDDDCCKKEEDQSDK